ncbi:polycystic kidney disease 1-like 2 [Labeo rohita]|uniref:Polycystic kidney disease 1-like 2 n=1 Tax=Labeo rohita TaxID=84645 RepID=A0A498NJE6_LABRO|nr:polycystic kidney disease 1-like 2 [Labeo rohita]
MDSAILHCGSDQVIEVDESYFGRKTPHYCRSNITSSLTSSLEQCSWISVLDVVAGEISGGTSSVSTTIQYSCIKIDKNQLKSSIDNELSLLTEATDTEEFREYLLSDMCATLEEPLQQPTEVLTFAGFLTTITKNKDKLNVNAQENAGCALEMISKSLKSISMDNITQRTEIASLLVASSSHILAAFNKESDISGHLFNAVDSVQTFLLANKTPDLEPSIITSPNVNIYVNRISPANLQKEPFSVENSSAGFKLPNLGSDILPVDEPVDVKVGVFQSLQATVKITVLEDNDPFAEYCYLLKISTGHRMGSSTSSRVIVTLQGTEGECEPHHLTDPDKPVFERGGVDLFLLTTPFSLGELQSIRLWHDNSGDHPAWYVNSVMVEDLQTEQKWHFLCSSWLAVDIDDCTVERVFPVASETEMKGFSNLFFMKTTTDFCDGHIWYSVVSRPPSSNFTRVQRVSCCFSVLLCSMLTSIMFYGIPTDPSEQTMDMGQIKLTWSQVIIGIQSSFIVFPINLVIVGIFRHSRPRKKKVKKEMPHKQSEPPEMEKDIPYEIASPDFDLNNLTVDFLIKDIQRITYLFANAMRCSVPKTAVSEKEDVNFFLSELQNLIEQQHLIHKNETSSLFWPYTYHLSKQLENVEGEVRLLGPSGFSRPGCYSKVLLQVQSMKKLLESLRSSRPISEQRIGSSSPKKDSSRKGLPWWFVYVGWLLVAATSVVSGYFTMLYGLKYGKDRSVSWIISIAMSFTESLFFTQPVKVLCLAIFFALVVKKVSFEDAELVDTLRKKATTRSAGLNGVRLSKRDCTRSYYQPPPPSDIERIKRNMVKQQKARALIMEILVFLGFLWMLLLVAYGQRDENGFYLTHHIRQSFSNGISDSMNHNDVFTWANTVLLNNLFGQYPGFITDGNSKLVGSARLRQVRVKRDSCKIAKSMRHSVPDCNAPYSWENEDMGSYGPGWDEFNFVNGSEDTITAWQYQSQSTLKAIPVWGMIALYRGGGYVMDLGSDLQNASRKLQYLVDSTWLDMYTRVVFAEFTVYNANVNLFCIVTLMLESTAVGAFQFRSVVQSVRLYQSTGGFQSFLMASQVFYFLFIVYYMFLQAKLLKRQKCAYFKNKWNLLDLAIIILSWSSLSVFIKRTVQGDKDIEYYQNHKDQFPSFHDTAVVDATLGYLMAFLVLLACVKLWHLLRLNPKLHLITSSLQRAWNDMSSFIVVIFIVLLAYSLTCNLIFGWKLYSYKTFPDAFITIFSLQFGIFNYDEVLSSDPVLGAIIISTCVIFITFVILTLFVSVILEAFGEEQENHQVLYESHSHFVFF